MSRFVTAYKSLAPNEYTITPFRAYASHAYTNISGSSENSVDVKVLLATQYSTGSGLRVENEQQEWYDSIIQTFYSPIPYASYGIVSSSYHPTGSIWVLSVTQDIFGEQIRPGTFVLTVGASSSIDDGLGNLIVSESGTGSIVGRIFYDKGIAIVQPTSSVVGGLSRGGLCIVSGSGVTASFDSSVTLFEHNIRVKLAPTDFLFSLYNPTVQSQILSGSTQTPLELMTSQSLYPYITTIGLYNQDNELLAVAKVSNPIQRTDYTTQTFVIKLDT